MIGQSVAHYQITDKIGAGGMGEVYRATDTRLNRQVALKVLPQVFAQDEQRMGRFEREAQVLASLNHPNIAQIHGLEEANGTKVLVMELVEGEDLSERIARGAIPLEEALPIALQIAEGLESAHEKGIIHRDLKPANIKLTADGKIKILDFGLAKALEDPVSKSDSDGLSRSPTLSVAATQAGIILGTAAYMSPEQAKGKAVDRRCDIWAYGAVLYEMLTGAQAFQGEDLSEVMAAVIMKEVGLDALAGIAPKPIERLIVRCLERDSRRRLSSISEARIAIEDYVAGPNDESEGQATVSAPPLPLWKRVVPWTAAAVSAIILIAFLVLSPQPLPPPISRMAIVLPTSQQILNSNRQMVAFSPDGTHLVYVANNGLYVRAMDQLEATPIKESGGARSPFFSPDGQWVGFWALGEMKKVSINGGAPVSLCETPNPYGASWAEDGRIVFAIETEGIFQVPAAGGSRELLIRVDPKEIAHGPRILPGGGAVLFTLGDRSGRSWDYAKIVVQALGTDERKVLVDGGTDVRYLPTGHLAYVRAGTLMVVPFDLGNLELSGDPVSVVEGVRQSSGDTGSAQFGVSDLGSLAYVPGGSGSEHTLVWVDRKGAEEPIKTAPRPFGQPRLSPDGRLLALEIEDDIWVYDLVRGTTTRVTFDGGNRPAWTPDGRRIAFTHPSGIFMASIDHSSEAERLTEGYEHHSNAISPDGKTLLFHAHNQGGSTDILTLQLDNQSEPQPWLATAFAEDGPSFSQDGKWIVFVSNESGQAEIYVRPFPGPGGRTKVSTEGGDQPVWKKSGEIFYKQDDQMMAVPIQTEPELVIGRPEKLFEGQYVYGNVGPFPSYDATPDGQRFVMLKEYGLSGETRQEIVVVLNWFEELKRLVPAK